MNSKVGLTLAGRAHDLREVQAVAKAGLGLVEINLLQGRELMASLGELKDMAQKWGLGYLVHAPNEGDPKDLKRLGGSFLEMILKLLDGCLEIGAKLLTVHFWMDRRFIPEEVLRTKARILAKMVREGSSRGIKISLENLSEDSLDLSHALKESPELGLTLDVGHGELMCLENRALELLERFPQRVFHVHLHDNLGGDLVGDDLHLPVGEGKIDFKTFLEKLMGSGYSGAATLEVPVQGIRLSMERILGILEQIRNEKVQGAKE